MSKKQFNTANIESELAGASLFFQKGKQPQGLQKPTSNVTQKPAQVRATSRTTPRGNSRSRTHENISLPTRNEIQEFSFKLRDELKVKVQAEVPPHWQKEFDDLAHNLGVGKLELYRYILGEFLGKVKRKKSS